ncbi:extracellular calcium-sensing receptor-like [Microcaecilia unicolor]|uniref:Extracellular calcium-sensing receptor-like n=1 Tax=Microcaecilia unicolor TaxID=1415580 RepID=A0A6P7WVL4_9AMPH|nr:extracellular calcium-sensing receptor-like [Microcaecilia unicolor]
MYCLMPVAVFQMLKPGCQLPGSELTGYLRAGDVLIGGIFQAHSDKVYPETSFRMKPSLIICQMLNFQRYQWLQSMVFAIEEINKDPDLLPNITLGFWIYDSCIEQRRSLEGTLWIVSGRGVPILNYWCQSKQILAAFVGESGSTRSIVMARLLGLYRYTQVSYLSTSPVLSDRIQFPSFLRTVPSDDFQSQALAQLVIHFGWTWVGLLAQDNDYGQQGMQLVRQEIVKAGACVAFSETVSTTPSNMNAVRIVQVIKNSTVNAIIVFSSITAFVPVMDEVVRQNVIGKIWIASEGWSIAFMLHQDQYLEVFAGTIGVAIHNREMPGLKKFLGSLHPSKLPGDIFIRKFWEEAFSCKWPEQEVNLTWWDNRMKLCSGIEEPGSLQNLYRFDFDWGTYNVYNAVYTIAQALNDLSSCQHGRGPFLNGTCTKINDFKPWQLFHYVKHVHFQNKMGEEVYFDRNGEPPALYDIVNWHSSPEGTIKHEKVGGYSSLAPPGQTLMINSSAILWPGATRKIPISVCSPSCSPGYRKVTVEGKPICCFQCTLCPPGEISNQPDSTQCWKCPSDQWPNSRQDECVPMTIEFLSYEEPLGAALGATSILFSLITVSSLGLFIYYRNTSIVKANNCNLSYLLLLALTLCFLCSLVFIGYPSLEKCLIRQTAFGISFSFCVSCVLAKTIMVVIAFNANKPNSDFRRWLGAQLSYVVISVCTLIQVLVCLSWLFSFPPFSEYNTRIQPGKIIVECNEGSLIAFWCMLGYLGLLAMMSFIVAFLARNLPDSFNEAKFITFSMLAFLSVWLSFIPAYLSTQGKYMVAMEIFAILSSSFALLSCIFFPKCYIILLRPDLNTKEYLMGRGKALRHM